MKQENKVLAIGIITMLLLNFFGSIGSRMLDFNYSYLSVLSFTIYGVTGFIVTKYKNWKTGALFAAIIGLTESTLGSVVSKLFGEPNIGNVQFEMTTQLWVITIVSVTFGAALTGLIGGGITRSFEKKTNE